MLLDALACLLALEPHQLEQADLRDGVAVARAGDDQRRDDRERQRDLDLERRAARRRRSDVDRAADLLDVRS